MEREGVWWVLETKGTSVAATNRLRTRVVENEFREQKCQLRRPIHRAGFYFGGLEQKSDRIGYILKAHSQKGAWKEEVLMERPQLRDLSSDQAKTQWRLKPEKKQWRWWKVVRFWVI